MSPYDEILTNQASGMSAAPLPSPFGPNDHGSLVFGSFVMFSFKTLKKRCPPRRLLNNAAAAIPPGKQIYPISGNSYLFGHLYETGQE